ncbi:MAG TPA: formylmethanofuran dehydrogenase [Burkholderiaceae bacterium]|nr:formylmethanofuran dehydrogenase [Burkholderiaceae bacterium]
MTDTSVTPRAGATRWTCPFCLLLCDTSAVQVDDATGALTLSGAGCACASRALARFSARPHPALPQVDGTDCTIDEAVAAAARLLAASRQPLFGGLGTDVSGARALYRLACRTGAICDAAQGAALMHGVRALQDRGSFFTTLAEVRTRADLIVCLGDPPLEQAPDFFARCGVGDDTLVPQRQVLVLGGSAAGAIPLQGDLFGTVATLSALVARRTVREASAPLAALAARLQQARYAVIVGETQRLPAQGALVVEGVHRIVNTLNQTTRAAAMWLGGGNGAGTVNQVFTWLSGLPLRSRAGPRGLEHEPLCFDAQRLLAGQGADSLLWVSSFDPETAPPATDLPTVVLGHPDLGRSRAAVFIPVSTPGIGSPGHLFRADGSVMLPLHAVFEDTLPTLASVLDRIGRALA